MSLDGRNTIKSYAECRSYRNSILDLKSNSSSQHNSTKQVINTLGTRRNSHRATPKINSVDRCSVNSSGSIDDIMIQKEVLLINKGKKRRGSAGLINFNINLTGIENIDTIEKGDQANGNDDENSNSFDGESRRKRATNTLFSNGNKIFSHFKNFQNEANDKSKRPKSIEEKCKHSGLNSSR